MATTTLNAGDVYITDGQLQDSSGNHSTPYTRIETTGAQKIVRITSVKIDNALDNTLSVIPIPVSKSVRGTTPFARIIDLKRIKESLTVTGNIEDESGVTAESKRDDLLSMTKTGGELTMVYGPSYATNDYQTAWFKPESGDDQNNRGVFVIKITFTSTIGKLGEAVGGASDQESPERMIGIILTIVRGKDM